MVIFILYGGYFVYSDGCGLNMEASTHGNGIVDRALAFGSCSPWVAFGTAFGGISAFWVAILAACQSYQMFWLGMTT